MRKSKKKTNWDGLRKEWAGIPAMEYCFGVVDGKIPACKTIIQCCERHLNDLIDGPKRGLYFDQVAGQHAIKFFRFLRHSKGEWARHEFELAPWQAFIIWCLFGWMREDGIRRFRTAYVEIPRKNGKSTLAAGIGLYLFFADGESGAEVYVASTKREQSLITFSEATRMVKSSPDLSKRIGIYKNNLHVQSTFSKFEPLGADADTMDGLNISGAVIDELHAHKTSAVVDVLETATGARRQPLIFEITTAGFNRSSICWAHHEYSERILKNTNEDDAWFAYIANLDEKDAWDDPTCWAKANPNYGVSVKTDDIARLCNKARNMPAAQNAFKRLRLNVWTQQADRWIDIELWDAQGSEPIDEYSLIGRNGHGSIDLSSVSDLTVWMMVFPRPESPMDIDILMRVWCPRDQLYNDKNKNSDLYRQWVEEGFMQTTPGNAIDYSFVREQVIKDCIKFNRETGRIIDINIDRGFQSYETAMRLTSELERITELATIGTNFSNMDGPMKELERRLLEKRIHHGGNPILRWMADNLSVKQDSNERMMPDKATSQGKIDGILTLLMCLDRQMRYDNESGSSVYEKRGVLSI